jgi:hypothetical protein
VEAAVEALGGGVAVIDFDGDGLLDLAFAVGLSPNNPMPEQEDTKQSANGPQQLPGTPSIAETTTARPTARPTVDHPPLALFRNLGGMRFAPVAAAVAGIARAARYGHGVFAADYDNDGFADYLVTGWGGPAQLTSPTDGPRRPPGPTSTTMECSTFTWPVSFACPA